jgi:hypothetical protein
MIVESSTYEACGRRSVYAFMVGNFERKGLGWRILLQRTIEKQVVIMVMFPAGSRS